MKACKDCRWFKSTMGQDRCLHPELQKFDPVWGEVPLLPSFNRGYRGQCGPKAKFFEPKVSFAERIFLAFKRAERNG